MSGRRAHPVPETLRCRACAEPFAWDGRSARRPHYCPDATCRRRRTNARAYAYFLKTRAKGCGTQARPGSLPRPLAPPLPLKEPVRLSPPEPSAHVERLFRAARAARLAEERRTGQRRYTVTDGWAMRGSRYENPGSDNQGDGWG